MNVILVTRLIHGYFFYISLCFFSWGMFFKWGVSFVKCFFFTKISQNVYF